MSKIEVNKLIPQSGTDVQLGESGDTITIPAGATITNNGTANGFGSADTEKVKVSSNDTTAGFLNGKLVAGTNISLTEGSDGGDETLTAAFSGTISTAQIGANQVTGAKLNTDVISAQTELAAEPADTDELLVSDAGVLKRVDYSHIKASPAMELLSTVDITSSTAEAEFDGLFSSTYKNYKIIISGLLPVTNSARLNAQMKEGGSYITSGAYTYLIGADIVYNTTDGSTTNLEKATNGTKVVMTSEMKNSSGETNSLEINIYDPLGSHYKAMTWHNQNYGSVLTNLFRNYVGASVLRNSTNDCTAIKFYMDSGNIAKGNFKLYGIK